MQLLAIFVCSLAVVPSAHADVSYSYDDLGRIKTVRSATGEIAEYVYDAVGNILQIRRVGSGGLAVTGFSPNSGPVGASVTINGSGFSTTTTSNTVKFNGVAAAVSFATATALTTTVPAGASTGPVSVTAGTSTATSLDLFTVVSGAGRARPTITDFTPKMGPANTSVTVTGTNFDPNAGATRVELSTTLATSSITNASTLTMAVPAKTGSGKILVSTAAGTAQSVSDFIVVPPTIPQPAIVATGRIDNYNQTATVAINSQNSYGLVLVDAYQGSYLSLDLPTFTLTPSTAAVSYTVYAPDNSIFTSGVVSATNRTIHLPVTSKAGTYTVAFYTGAATVTLGVRVAGAITAYPQSKRSIATSFPGQSTRLQYLGAAGESLGLEIAGMSTAPVGKLLAVSMFLPSGVLFQSVTTSAVGSFLQLPVLPVAGTYTIVVSPAGTAETVSLSLTVDSGIALSVNGGSVSATLATPGEAARFVYTAPVTLPVQVNVTSIQLGGTAAVLSIYKPDGTKAVISNTCGMPCAIIVPGQATSGPFSIVAKPAGDVATGSVSVSVTASDGIGALNPSTPTSVAVGPGKSVYYTFTASAGESPSVLLQYSPGSGYYGNTTTVKHIKVYKPDGTLFVQGPDTTNGISCNGSPGGGMTAAVPNTVCTVQLANLPTSGTYTVSVQPYIVSGTVTVTATLYREAVVSNPASGTSVANILSPSQNLKATFTASAGESPSVLLQFSPSNGYNNGSADPRYIKIYKPDGALLLDGPVYGVAPSGIKCNGYPASSGGTVPSSSSPTTACAVQLANLPTSGTYTVSVQPYLTTGTVAVTATLRREAGFSITLPFMASLQPSQNAVFGFTTTAGRSPNLSLAFSPNSGYAGSSILTPYYIQVYKPDGTLLLSGPINGSTTGITCNNGGSLSTLCTVQMTNVPVGGTYKVVMQPYITTGTVSVTATLSGY